jgi:lysophospholipase L1-like esterase
MMIARRGLLLGALAALGCSVVPRAEGDAMAGWVRYAGRVLVMGDSITLGAQGFVGGWRPGLSSALSAASVGHVYVGPLSDAYGAHRAVSGTSAYQQTSAVQTDCETYDPRVVVIGYGANDVGGTDDGGQGRTAAQTIAELGEAIAWVQAGAPQALVLMQTVIVPQDDTIASYWARRAIFSELNALMPGLATSTGVRLIDVGAPETTDGLHPSAAGYAAMSSTIASAVLAVIPGA